MNLIEAIKHLANNNEVTGVSKDLLSDLSTGILGDFTALARALTTIMDFPIGLSL